MKCEEFEAAGLGLTREGATCNGIDAVERALAIEHANCCPRCAALQASWREAQVELQALRIATKNASAPPRVEMRLRQEFRTKYRTVKARRAAVVAAWTLAAAAVIVGAFSLRNWRDSRISKEASPAKPATGPSAKKEQTSAIFSSVGTPTENALIADNHADGFTLLPGSFSQETGDASIVRVRLQRGALGVLGLPVNEERAGEWIQVDLLVGEDGQPQAVRLNE
jgi:hypothetical protein